MSLRGFWIDKLTNSIEERATGKRLNTIIEPISQQQIKLILKKNGWTFNWKKEYKLANRQIYKLLLMEGDNRIQGLISIEPLEREQFIELHLIENAPHNFGSNKEYYGVAANLVAFACKLSFEMGFDGCVAFWAKTVLVDHYEKTLGARLLKGPNRMGIFTDEAKFLVNLYYKDFFNGR
jgi:hypothetical protein